MPNNLQNDNIVPYLLQIIGKQYVKAEQGEAISNDLKALEEKVNNLDTAGVEIKTDDTLSFVNGVLSVNTADNAEANNSLPITSAAVHTQIGNIETILKTI